MVSPLLLNVLMNCDIKIRECVELPHQHCKMVHPFLPEDHLPGKTKQVQLTFIFNSPIFLGLPPHPPKHKYVWPASVVSPLLTDFQLPRVT